MSKYIRIKALLPLSVVFALMAIWTLVFKDRTLRWAVRSGGTAAVGARVDLAKAHIDLGEGIVRMNGLAITNPSAPMTNLVEADELVFDIGFLSLLEKKVIIDTAAARGLRFNTARTVSGAIPHDEMNEEAAQTAALIDRFKSMVKVPSLDLSTLQKSVNVEAISADSLRTLQAATQALAFADTVRARFAADLAAADPRPSIDSAEALVTRLRGATLQSLGLNGVRRAVADIRRTITDLERADDRIKALEASTKASSDTVSANLAAIPAAKVQDYAYARSLLQLPTFEIPTIGPQLMSDIVADRMGSVLYWLEMAKRYAPPGFKRQLQSGPSRVRASGTDVLFPKENVLPSFLMRLAELSLTLGGEGASAGDYTARFEGLTSQPAVYGRPTTFFLDRTSSAADARDIRVAGMLDHRTDTPRDSVNARMNGIPLPRIPLGGLGATVNLGAGLSHLNLTRSGDAIDGTWTWRAPNVTWVRDTTKPPAATAKQQLIDDVIWRALSRLDSVEIEANFGGTLSEPTLGVKTNIANALESALRETLGEEVRRAEQQVRTRVNELVDAKVAEARTQADRARTEVTERVAAERARLEEQKRALEARLRELTRIPGIG
jgi:uncharacterized protein (TIGR03545 family)